MHLELMRESARQFPAADDPAAVRTARIWHCKFKSLAPLASLSELRELAIATYPDGDLHPISQLTHLQYLSIVHLPAVTDLQPLSKLTELTSLSLATLSSWDSSGRVTVVASLKPLAQLPKLAHLELFGVVNEARSLADLKGCSALQSAKFSKFPEAEITSFFEGSSIAETWNPEPSMPAV
jgi:hypothetical protein